MCIRDRDTGVNIHIISIYIDQRLKQFAESILLFIRVVDAKTDGKIALCVAIYQQHAIATLGQRNTQIVGGSSFTYTAFSIQDSNYFTFIHKE